MIKQNLESIIFDYDDIRLISKECVVESRNSVDIQRYLGNTKFNIGVVPANMVSTINEELAIKLASAGYFYIYHRFNHNNIDFVRMMNEKNLNVSISVGVNDDSYNQLKAIKNENLRVDYICIDIANGFYYKLTEMAKFIRDNFPYAFIIGGNVGTPQGVEFVEKSCDASKIGQGPGKCCSTVLATSVGTNGWQAKVLYECSKVATKPTFGDGGIRTVGHCSVGFLFSDWLMVGSMLSNFTDSPGNRIVAPDGKHYIQIYGSASVHCSKNSYIEGHTSLMEPSEKTMLDYMGTTLSDGIKSAISYLGGTDMSIYNNAEWVVIK
jgi:GMP reductase